MNENYKQELNDVLDYAQCVLGNEFGIKNLTIPTVVLAILSNNKCNAYKIIQCYIREDMIENLRASYANQISSIKIPYHTADQIDLNYLKLMRYAEGECDRHQPSSGNKTLKIGTEHVLLALFNEEIKKLTPLASNLEMFGLFYNNADSKCSNSDDDDDVRPFKSKLKKKPLMELKSQINKSSSVDNGVTPFIDQYTINITEKAENGDFDNLINRPEYLNKIVQVLCRKIKNNVVLVGNAGVGTSSLVNILAKMIHDGNVPSVLENKKVLMLDTLSLVSGTTLRGMFEERVNGLFSELTSSPNYILFIDNMQMVVRNTGRDKDGDLTDLLGPVLSDGVVRVIGTISFKDYRSGIEHSPSLARKFQKIIVEEATEEECFDIVKASRNSFEKYHHVSYTDADIKRAIGLAKRYITSSSLPDSAIDIIDITGARMSISQKKNEEIKALKKRINEIDDKRSIAMYSGDFELEGTLELEQSEIKKKIKDKEKALNNNKKEWTVITEDDIDDTVSNISGIPISKLKSADKESVLRIDEILKEHVIGQDEAISEIAKAIKRNKAGFNDKNKVYATFMFVSKTGCGKTLLAKQLAEQIFGSEKALIRFDMSEYQDKTSVNKLIGSSAGYVGYENGGLLTEAIKNKPYCVLLFDEIEKADESIYNLFLQLFDEGRLTDNNGTLVNFKNVIVIMTSNVGAKQASELGNGVGFVSDASANKKNIVERALKSKFNPEFLNRIDKIVHFNPLSDENLKTISKIELDKVCNRVKENGVTLKYTDAVVDYVYQNAIKQKEYGARPIMRIIQDNISDKVVDLVLTSDSRECTYNIDVNENKEIVATIVK